MSAQKADSPKRRGRPPKAVPVAVAAPSTGRVLIESNADLVSAPAYVRENPQMLAGEALRTLAHKRGLSRSEAQRLSDDKIREQLRYMTHAQYEMG